jgi:hypothetical protein
MIDEIISGQFIISLARSSSVVACLRHSLLQSA